MSNAFKVWGERRRLLLTKNAEIDLLYLKKHTFCSYHTHQRKINRFVVVSGKIRLDTEFGKKILTKNQSFEIMPKLKHRFFVLRDAVVIELAYTSGTRIDEWDIFRYSQGGKLINGNEVTENELNKKHCIGLATEYFMKEVGK